MSTTKKYHSRNGRIQQLFSFVIILIVILSLWQFVSATDIINPGLFPPPTEVLAAFIDMARSGQLVSDILISLSRILVGFVFGAVCGIAVGLLTGRIAFLADSLGQLIQILRPIPAIAMVPITLVWFGIGELSKYFLVYWGVFFPIWLNTHLGASNVEQKYIWAAQSLGASRKQLFYKIIFPASLPMIIAGMRTGIAIAFVCLVAAEMIGAFGGIGYRIFASHMVFRVDRMMVGIMVLGILGAVTDRAFAFLAGRVFPWYNIQRT